MDSRPRPTIIRARLRAYDAVTHTADIEPIGAPEALMDAVPCLQSIPTTDLVVGNTVIVLVWGDVGGLVLGAYGGLPTTGHLDGDLNHDGTAIGLFGVAPTTQTTVADQAAWADVTTGTDHVDLPDLNTKMQALRDKLQALLDALQSYGLI